MPGMLGMARHRHAWGWPRVGVWTLMILAGPFQMGISRGFMISSCCGVQESPVSHPWGPLRIPEVPLCRGFPNLASPLSTGQAGGHREGTWGAPGRAGDTRRAWHCPLCRSGEPLYPHLCTAMNKLLCTPTNKLLCTPTAAVPTAWNLLLPAAASFPLSWPRGVSCPALGVPVFAVSALNSLSGGSR